MSKAAPSPAKSPGRRRSSFFSKLIEAGDKADTTERRLNHYACADAYHDFGDNFNTENRCDPIARGLCDVRKGLPDKGDFPEPTSRTKTVENANKELHTENEVLVEVFRNVDIPGVAKKIVDPAIDNNVVQTLIDIAVTANGSMKNLKLKGIDVNGKQAEHSYTYNLFKDNDTYDIREITERHGGISDSKSLHDFFGADSAHIVVDAASISLVELIKSAKTGDKFNIIRLINRELVNDPAPKTYEDEQGYFLNSSKTGANSGVVRYEIYLERPTGNIIYSSKSKSESGEIITKENEFGRGNFHSIYDFKMSDLNLKDIPESSVDRYGTRISNILQNLPKLAVDVDLPGGPRIYQTSDPHETNSIESVNQRLDEIFANTKDKHVNAAAHYQCKRSGDWLQALSCQDTSRQYWRAARDGGEEDEIVKITNYPIILVTHDRVLMAYALLLGIDVLFTYIYDKREDEGGAEESLSNRKKFLLYFKNEKNDNPDNQLNSQIATIKNAYDMVATNKVEINTFNQQILTWISMIQTANVKEIEEAYTKAEKDHTKITNLVRSYIKFTNVDYQLSNIINSSGDVVPSYKRDIATFTNLESRRDWFDEAVSKLEEDIDLEEKNEIIEGLNEIYKSARSAQNVVRTRLHQKSETPNLEALVASASSYSKSPLYFSTIPLNTVVKEMRARGRGLVKEGPTNETRVGELVSYLTSRMDNRTYAKLISQLESLKTTHGAKLDNTLFSIFDIMVRTAAPADVVEAGITQISEGVMNEAVKMMADEIKLKEELRNAAKQQQQENVAKLNAVLEANAAKQTVEATDVDTKGVVAHQAVEAAVEEEEEIAEAEESAEHIDNITEDIVSDLNATAKAIEVNLNAPESEEYETAIDASAKAEVAVGQLDAKKIEVALPANKKRRLKLSKPFNTIGTAITSFVGGVINLFKKRSASVASTTIVGTSRRGRRGGADLNLYAKVLVVGYLRELRNSLAGYDSFGDFDYEYYEAIAHVVRSITNNYKPNRNYFIRLATLFYNEIPYADFSPLFSSQFDTNSMATAVRSMTLASFGRASGEIPNIGYSSEIDIDYKFLISSYNSFQQIRYNRRRDFLIDSLGKLIKRFAYEGDTFTVPDSKSNELQRLMSRMRILTSNSPIEPWQKPNTRALVPATAAGGGTRRRKVGGKRAASAVNKGRYRRSLKRSTRKSKGGKSNNE